MIVSMLLAASVSAACPSQDAALARAADLIERRYLDAGQGRAIAKDVRAWAAAGRYRDLCDQPDAFVDRFNRDLDAYDPHFMFERIGGAGADQDWLSQWRADSRKVNAGVREVRVLEGNIGYIRLASFYPWDLAGPKLKAAFALVGDADGLILDLRQNGGGDDATAGQIVSAFLGGREGSVQSLERRGERTEDPLPALDLPVWPETKPVAVLIDRRSASASEFVAYSLQAAHRASVIGARSAGVAHQLGDPEPLTAHFALAVPDARPVNRITGEDWEGRGVIPDMPGGDDAVFVARQRLSPALVRPR